MRRPVLPALAMLALGLGGCATTPATPEVTPDRIHRSLISPRSAGGKAPSRSVARRFDAAWAAYQQGRLEQAERGFTEILSREPDDGAAELGLAAIAITRGDLNRAEQLIDRAAERLPDSTTLQVYRAELAHARADLRTAHMLYRRIIEGGAASPPAVERYEQVRGELFNQLFSQATSTTDPETAARLLREALEVNRDSAAARRLLGRRLVDARQFDAARRELEPFLIGEQSEDEEVQELLSEIDAGRGRYQEAIARYERLVRRSGNPSYQRRLEQIKREYIEANRPPQHRRALESPALTRAELSVLIYWNIPAIRFARNLPEPPIAVDVAEVIGREELIRAMSFRFFTVDPITRRIEPDRVMSAGSVLRILARIATLRGVPPCSTEAAKEPNEMLRAVRILEACGIPIAGLTPDLEAPVSGRIADRALMQLATLLKSTEERQARQ